MHRGAGLFSEADLEQRQADWVDVLSTEVFGVELRSLPPNSQGYLTLGTTRLAADAGLPTEPDEASWAHLLIEAATAASYDRPAAAARGRRRLRPSSPTSSPRGELLDLAGASRRPIRHVRRRHHLPVRGRRRRVGGQPDPVERRRVRVVPRRADDVDQPAEPRHRVLACRRGIRPSWHPGAARRTRCAPPSSVATGASPPCSERWAVTPSRRSSPSSSPACSTPDSRWRRRSPRRVGRSAVRRPGSTRGPDRRRRRSSSRRGAAGVDRGAAVARPRRRHGRPFDGATGHANAIVIEPNGTFSAAADPRALIGAAAAL